MEPEQTSPAHSSAGSTSRSSAGTSSRMTYRPSPLRSDRANAGFAHESIDAERELFAHPEVKWVPPAAAEENRASALDFR